MREIKFRGKRADNDQWVYGGILTTVYGENCHRIDIVHFDNGYGSFRNLPIIADTLGQYTGLKDENDKEIYEGDIVKCTHSYISRFDNQLKTVGISNGEVCFSLYGFKINVDKGEHLYGLGDCDNIEILDNIALTK